MEGYLRSGLKIEKLTIVWSKYINLVEPHICSFRAAEVAYSLAWAEMEYIGSDKVRHSYHCLPHHIFSFSRLYNLLGVVYTTH